MLGQDTGGELVGGHFEAEQHRGRPGRLVRLDPLLGVPHEPTGGGEGHVGAERALAHARTAGDDHQVGLVKAADLGVEAVQAGGEARQMAAAVERPLGHFERVLGGFGERLGLAGGPAFLGDLVELGLRLLDLLERSDLLAGVERAFDKLSADADQRPKQREVVNLRREVACADDRRARSRQLG